jgi:coenzyme F420-reducing hydrogenase alpha subunit
MSTNEERIASFLDTEITITLPKQHLRRLYNVFKQAHQEMKERRQDFDAKEYGKYVQESLEDPSILGYLDWVLKQDKES